jgi:hypothetical protein
LVTILSEAISSSVDVRIRAKEPDGVAGFDEILEWEPELEAEAAGEDAPYDFDAAGERMLGGEDTCCCPW